MRTRKKNDTPTEAQEMVVLAAWLDLHRVCWFHVPNEGWRHYKTGRQLRAQGMKRGVPDAMIFDPPRFVIGDPVVAGVAIELKRQRGGTVQPEQKEWLLELEKRRWVAFVARGAGEAIDRLIKLGFGGSK